MPVVRCNSFGKIALADEKNNGSGYDHNHRARHNEMHRRGEAASQRRQAKRHRIHILIVQVHKLVGKAYRRFITAAK